MNFTNELKSMQDAGLDEETLKTLKMLQNTEEMQSSIQENAKEARGGYDAGRGIEFFGFVEHLEPGKTEQEGSEIKIKSPQTTTIRLLHFPSAVNAIYGVIEKDNETNDEHVRSAMRVVNARNKTYVPSGDTVLKVKVRPTENELGNKYGKDIKIKDRPVTIIQCLKPGDRVRGGMFIVDNPKGFDGKEIPVGSIVRITCAKAHEYHGRSMWNFGAVSQSPINLFEQHEKMFEKQILVPRNSYPLMKIDEEPIDYNTPQEQRVELSPELDQFLNTDVLIATWATDLASSPERATREVTKRKNTLFQPAIFTDVADDYGGKVEAKDNKPERHYARTSFLQTAIFKDLDSDDSKKQKRVLLDVRLRELQCGHLLGIANPAMYKELAKAHVPKMKFAVMCRPAHKETFNADINKADAKPEEFKDIDFGIVYKSTPASFAHSNLRYHVYNKGIPVNYDFVQKALAGGKSMLKSPFFHENIYNSSVGNDFLVLSEYDGPVDDFKEDYVFRVLKDSSLVPLQEKAISDIDGEEERAKMCSESMLGIAKNDQIGLGQFKKTMAVYALKKSLCEAMDKEPEKYNFERYIKLACDAQANYDPAEADKQREEMKRTMAENEANRLLNGNKRSLDNSDEEGSQSKRARNESDEEGEDDDESR